MTDTVSDPVCSAQNHGWKCTLDLGHSGPHASICGGNIEFAWSAEAPPTGITPLTPQQTAVQEQEALKEGYVRKDLIGLDQFVNVLLDGDPDETISSRAARWATEDDGIKKHIGEAVSRGLDLFQSDHGAKAEAGDDARADKVAEIENTSGDISPAPEGCPK